MQVKTQFNSALEIKIELLHRRLSVAELARKINRPRSTVSQAIHQAPRFPLVRAQIEKFLCH